ncbi:c-type cytochrome [Chengkuizengella sediminis]|uniref:c-type cytochrome n=1 Tax=Chengkuizengella sediminis TaxID=1885917 RepID=UPI00138A2FF0|nr:c-type cytochrome [Chengkuizengella sediminis]NDI33905.1 c-type cytochrome [Chengkuizengella sediminis]
MKNGIIIFLVSVLVGLGSGYLFYQSNDTGDQTATPPNNEEQIATETENNEENVETVSNLPGEELFVANSCLNCHSISKLGIEGGVTGPDLSDAYKNVEDKHGKKLEDFLKEPTSAVMSGVISGNPLTDDDRLKIVEMLKKASDK